MTRQYIPERVSPPITFTSAPDYESPADDDTNNVNDVEEGFRTAVRTAAKQVDKKLNEAELLLCESFSPE